MTDDSVDWERLESETASPETEVEFISADMLARRILWDVVPCSLALETGSLIGLPSASEEIEEREHQEAHGRIRSVAGVIPYINDFAVHASRAIVGAQIVNLPDEEGMQISEEDREDTTIKLHPLLFQATLAIVAELVDVGVLHLPHMVFDPELVQRLLETQQALLEENGEENPEQEGDDG